MKSYISINKQILINDTLIGLTGTINQIRSLLLVNKDLKDILDKQNTGLAAGVFVWENEIHILRCKEIGTIRPREVIVKYYIFGENKEGCSQCRECYGFLESQIIIDSIIFNNI